MRGRRRNQEGCGTAIRAWSAKTTTEPKAVEILRRKKLGKKVPIQEEETLKKNEIGERVRDRLPENAQILLKQR